MQEYNGTRWHIVFTFGLQFASRSVVFGFVIEMAVGFERTNGCFD